MDMMNDYLMKISLEHNKQVDVLVEEKMKELVAAAYRQGEDELHEILIKRNANIENVRTELLGKGYTLELEYPTTPFKVDELGYISQAMLDIKDIKIRVRKIILEV